ncbi:MAG: AMP-binding enzyme, partial [Longimicrobiales bacterium]
VQNPLHDRYNDPIYRTGDRVRALAGGSFQFLGRNDHMVKVRGYRIELGEVEHALHSHRSVREAAVVPLDHDDVGTRLHAAVVLESDGEVSEEAIRSHCNDLLLRYAIPETISIMCDLPRTSTGKVDRIKLQQQLDTSLEQPVQESP